MADAVPLAQLWDQNSDGVAPFQAQGRDEKSWRDNSVSVPLGEFDFLYVPVSPSPPANHL